MNIYDKVENIINEWDPISLLPLFPNDEYKDEVFEIVKLLRNSNDCIEIAKSIKQIFEESFSKDVFNKNIEECIVIAQELLEK